MRALLLLTLAGTLCAPPARAQWPSDDAEPAEFSLGINAKLLCSGIWVQGRDAVQKYPQA